VRKPPSILLTGINGVGKSTILNLFPGEIILEIDDDFNEIIQKSVKFIDSNKIKEFTLREIDLNELVHKFNSYHSTLRSIDMIFLVVDSTERNIIETQDLLLNIKDKLPEIKFFTIANFQDRKAISWNKEEIERFLQIRTYAFSAIQDDSEETINNVIKDILKGSSPKEKEKSKIPTSNKFFDYLWSEIEEAIFLESKYQFHEAAKIFSNMALKIKDQNIENEEIKALHYLCKAWQTLEIGEATKTFQKFSEAEVLFNQANEHLSEIHLKNLVYANSIFCEILKLSYQFDETETTDKKDIYYPKIQTLLKRAIEFYSEAGFIKEEEWAKNALKKMKN
jgi:hypothetical protein